ncbi:hypothetical protein DFJ58DRAFT_731017 [Suillus subalutaceus]|uniref:uncharacterized protein n=1 Tax=Suillus subalutaceus TaxID=48586 RepID=UPI001B862FA4|nr:uncharacterized protein DFJ58DRAFT_731017 [Suillus subalutaceus]KAG1844939.1 hypothetical protein DFJ58DRAFT_731017 [Suillus subalutaceus]
MADVHEHEVDINQDDNSLDGEVGEMEEQAGAEEQAGVEEGRAETFAVTRSAMMLWDYAQEIAQDRTEFACRAATNACLH